MYGIGTVPECAVAVNVLCGYSSRLDFAGGPFNFQTFFSGTTMHYPHKNSNRKRKRRIGFLARMKTRGGRATINRKRRAGRFVNSADKT